MTWGQPLAAATTMGADYQARDALAAEIINVR
jgi:hypothetical protein